MIGGYGRGWRHRRLYYLTGIPGLGRGRCFWFPPGHYHPDEAWDPRPGASWYAPQLTEEEELKMLEEEEQALKDELEQIAKKLTELRAGEKKKVR